MNNKTDKFRVWFIEPAGMKIDDDDDDSDRRVLIYPSLNKFYKWAEEQTKLIKEEEEEEEWKYFYTYLKSKEVDVTEFFSSQLHYELSKSIHISNDPTATRKYLFTYDFESEKIIGGSFGDFLNE